MTVRFCSLNPEFDERLTGQFVLNCPVPQTLRRVTAAIVATGGETEAVRLLEAGVPRVLIGQAALEDGELVRRLARRYSADRIGIYVLARPMEVNWSFETVSNADFKVVTPSIGAPSWDVLMADGSATGTHADWWIREMCARGASQVLIRADIKDNHDLNICAGLVEELGERLWVAPLNAENPKLGDWIEFGQVRQLALPPALYQRRNEWTLSDQSRHPQEVA
jgi:hypothetical protein